MSWNPFASRPREKTGRAKMKQLARECAAKLTPQPMKLVGRGTDRAGREVEILEAAGTRYARRADIVIRPYPIIKRDRVNGKIKSVSVATPTTPLRKIAREKELS